MKYISSCLLLLISFSSFAKGNKDTIYKTYNLKGDYKVVVHRNGDTNEVVLIHGDTRNVLNQADIGLGVEALGYVSADYKDVYIMTTHIDAQPVTFEVIDKAGASTVIYGKSPFYKDSIKNLLMFEGMYGKGRGRLILYNFNDGKPEYFTAPLDTPCFCCSCWKVVSLTDTEVKIEYENLEHKKVVRTYPRTK
jgi:hypothetical protein